MRIMTIEKAVAWAFREELPRDHSGAALRRPGSIRPGWGSVSSFAQLLAVIDDNRFGVVPDLAGLEVPPHQDAITIGNAVMALGDRFTVPDDWEPLQDCALGPHAGRINREIIERMGVADGANMADRRLFVPPSRLVVRHAILGGCPEWDGDKPVEVVERLPDGRPRWVLRTRRALPLGSIGADGVPTMHTFEEERDGWCARRRVPLAGAVLRTSFRPDPVALGVARAEYEIWHAALTAVADDVAGKLTDMRLDEWGRTARPWVVADRPVRILPDVSEWTARTWAKSANNRAGHRVREVIEKKCKTRKTSGKK
jgi:hypothetical protein